MSFFCAGLIKIVKISLSKLISYSILNVLIENTRM